jgi:uncharacterized membrane protein
MISPQPEQANHKMAIVIGNLLRAGVLASGAVVFIGGILYLYHNGLQIADYRVFQPTQPALCNVKDIINSAFTGQDSGIIQLGILILIATPIARVLFSLLAFLRQKDRLYVVITLIVLVILLYSLFSPGPAR